MGEAATLLESFHQHRRERFELERVDKALSQVREILFEIGAFPKKDHGDKGRDAASNRIEEEQKRHRCNDHMDKARFTCDLAERPDDAAEEQGDRGEHARAACEFIEIDQAIARDRLGEHIEENENEDGAELGDREADEWRVLEKREGTGRASDDAE